MIEELINALENLQKAKAEYKEAFAKCRYDKSYFLYEQIQSVDKAKEDLEAIFKSAVSAVVIEVIKEQVLPAPMAANPMLVAADFSQK